MREIKFRGRSTSTYRKVFGSLCVYSSCNGGKVYSIKEDDDNIEPVYEKTVGQYTGLKDKNGVEIYEGDIVKVWADLDGYLPEKKYVTAFIRFDDEECHFGWVVDYRYAAKVGYDESIQNVRYDIEVIGNIYDNPELLKEE